MNIRQILPAACVVLGLFAGFLTLGAQSKSATVVGTVLNASDGEPIDFATVVIKPQGLHTTTLADGSYSVRNVSAGHITVEIQFFGMNTFDTTFVASAGKTYDISARLQEANFRISDVVVTAKKSEAGSSTASQINRQALDHLQTSSLKDAMTLLPGAALTNPNLSSAQTLSIRNNTGTAMNSLGTSVIVDGAPMSNNANMQFLAPAQTGSTASVGDISDASSGVDIRSLSTDNLESIEVIRGIPSVQYGDLTSGAVIVKSRAGRSPLTVRFKTNPNIYQASATKGFGLGSKWGDVNVSGDYAYNRSELTTAFEYFQRASAKALWSVRPGEIVSMNNSVSVSYGDDRSDLNPDYLAEKTQYRNRSLGFLLNSNGTASINGEWLKSINWAASLNYTDKDSHYESTATNALNLYSTSMVDGQVYTNIAGQKIFDPDGNEITNASDTGVKGTVLPYSYFYAYDILGEEWNGFAKINAEFSHTWGPVTDRLLVGADFKTDGNLGLGAQYDDEFPPFRNAGNAASGYRRRPYYNIPFVNQIGTYAEDSFRWHFAGRDLNLTAGLRYLWVNGLSALDPRINASIDIFPWLTLRGGWGYASKAPTSMYLNPNYAYHDEILFNGMSTNLPESERLLLARTHVYDASNPDLEIARNRKAELGLDIVIAGRYKLYLTAYNEVMRNGYSFSRLPQSFIYYRHDVFKEVAKEEGSIPQIAKEYDTGAFFEVYMPANSSVSENSGLEYELDLGRFDAIRTSVSLNGAWTRGESYGNICTYNTSQTGNRKEHNIGVYEPGRVHSLYTSHLTTLRLTHNIPQIGFVVTLTGQVNWYRKYWSEYKNDIFTASDGKQYDIFTKYLSYADGQMHDIEFTESLITDPEFSYLCTPVSSQRTVVEKTPAFVIFNLNLTKEIGDLATASFYVNNVFNNRPLYRTSGSGVKRELGIPIFFGFEFKVNIR